MESIFLTTGVLQEILKPCWYFCVHKGVKGSRGFGKGGDKKAEIDILYSVITRLEVAKLNTEIEKIDPAAFVIMNSIKDTRGGMIKKRVLH